MVSARRPMLFVQQAGVTQNVEKVSHVLSSQKLSAQAYSPVARGSEAAFLSSHNLSAVISKIFGIVIGLCLQRSNRNVDIPRSKGHLWRRAIFHFLLCFICGLLIGFTPFMTVDISSKLELDHRTSQLDAIYPVKHSVRNENLTYMLVHINGAVGSEQELKLDTKDSTVEDVTASVQVDEHRKLLIVVTPTYKRTFQAYYLNRLACTLRLVPPPLLWIVVEASIQSAETATLLRKTGVMYRHLFSDQNSTSLKGRAIHQRNLALSHIEKHRLDGIVYFADDDNIYSKDLFQQMRSIRRFGTWPVAIVKSKSMIILEGPVCNGSQVIGWHTSLRHKGVRRFHVDMSGFAFNSTILWNSKRWKRTTAEPIRQLDTVRESFQGTSFIEQVVEDESQMEGIPDDCSRVMTWNLPMEAWATSSPHGWIMQSYLDVAASPK